MPLCARGEIRVLIIQYHGRKRDTRISHPLLSILFDHGQETGFEMTYDLI